MICTLARVVIVGVKRVVVYGRRRCVGSLSIYTIEALFWWGVFAHGRRSAGCVSVSFALGASRENYDSKLTELLRQALMLVPWRCASLPRLVAAARQGTWADVILSS